MILNLKFCITDANAPGLVSHLSRTGWVGIAEQIEMQLPKPRTPEPSMWGVVEAHTEGNPSRRRYGRTREDAWVPEGASSGYEWVELIDPVLIREGI